MRLDDLAEVTALAQERADLIALYRDMRVGLIQVEACYVGRPRQHFRLPEQIYRAVQTGALNAYLARLAAIHRRLTDLGVSVETITLADLGDPSTEKEPCP